MAFNRKELVGRINEAFAENDLEKVLSFCADDIAWTIVGNTTLNGKDPVRKWMTSMDPQPPQLTFFEIIAEGDTVVTRGEMTMAEKESAPSIPYSFCDFYRFEGDKVVELIAFMVRTDEAIKGDRSPNETGQMAGARRG